jgi:TPR repeat protein/thiol-disulfide isomerase/thioredoxin
MRFGWTTKLGIFVVIGAGMAGICSAEVAADKTPASAADANSTAKSGNVDGSTIKLQVGKPFPGLEFVAIDGNKVDVANMKGKVVLVYFWATWCSGCWHSDRRIADLYYDMHDKGFELIGISVDSDRQALDKYLARNKFKWPQYYDGKGWDNAVASRFGISCVPEMILVDKNGVVVDSAMSTPKLVVRVRELVTGKPIAAEVAAALAEAETAAKNKAVAREQTNKQLKAATDALVAPAQKGDARAQERLGRAYLRGLGISQDFDKARMWYRKAAEQGDAAAQVSLGQMYHRGEGVIVDCNEAFRWYTKAAEQGYPRGQRLLGQLLRVMYRSGDVTKDPNKAVALYAKAAEGGDPVAQRSLGGMYAGGGRVVPKDPNRAAMWYKKALESYTRAEENGIAWAMAEKGGMFLWGGGVPKDVQKGIALLTKAAEHGCPVAQAMLSSRYEHGSDVPQDYAVAVKWLVASAANGDMDSQNELGFAYYFGERGLPKDDRKAAEWLTRAAEQGDSTAQFRLAQMYADGEGVQRDYVTAYVWLTISERVDTVLNSGQEDRESLAKKMTSEQVTDAEKRAKAFVARRQPGDEEE